MCDYRGLVRPLHSFTTSGATRTHAPRGHAVCAVGFSEKGDESWKIPSLGDLQTPAIRRLYLHDDRLGPYARFAFNSSRGETTLKLVPSGQGDDWALHLATEELQIYSGIAPVYPKLRMQPSGLLGVADAWQKLALRTLPEARADDFCVQTRFALSGSVLRQLLASGIGQRAVDFAKTAFLSRYVGVVEFFASGQPVMWVLCDATDVNRDRIPTGNTVAIVPIAEGLDEYLRDLINKLPELSSVRVV